MANPGEEGNLMPEQKKYGCSHYQRKCEVLSPCCNNWVSCRYCHNEAVCDGKMVDIRTGKKCKVDEMDRKAVSNIRCLLCRQEQSPSKLCMKCGTIFAQYFCPICVFFDDDPAKNGKLWHCDSCGLCRVASNNCDPSHYVHCFTCNTCMPKEGHICRQDVLAGNCPICFEKLFTSREPIVQVTCGHSIHKKCLDSMLANNIFTCPLCGKSVVNDEEINAAYDAEIEAVPMPPEYSNIQTEIVCKECHKKSFVNWHVIGMKCQHCGSYNTYRV